MSKRMADIGAYLAIGAAVDILYATAEHKDRNERPGP